MIGRRELLAAAALLPAAAPVRTDWAALAADVRSEMRWAWGHYRESAWGHDQIRPISGGAEAFFKGRDLGLSLVEALDTLWVMGLDAEFAEGVAWVKANLSFDVDVEVSVFETSIRMVGGLLSAHHACGDPVLLRLAKDLADRLLPAFNTPTGLPYRYINLATGKTRAPETNPAEIGTHIPEFGTLSHLTGDPRYVKAAKRALVAMFDRRSKIGLVADKIHAETGAWLSRRATVGPPSDSYYEYLWDGWQLLGDRDCKRMYDTCTAGILKHQRDVIDGRLWYSDVDFETGAAMGHEQDELASFYGGLLAQGGATREGAILTESWAWLQDKYGVLPEGYDPSTGKVTSATNSLRPELADSAFNLWLLDRNPRWREIGRVHYENMKRWNRAPYGYATLSDVVTKTQSDHCPGYWWSEQMKYYFLLFADAPRFDYARNYLSTEGNVLLGFKRP